MLSMENWIVHAPDYYSLGFAGDHLATDFELSAPLPEGWDLKVDVEREGKKNVIQLEREGERFFARLTAEMLGEDGYYFLQIRGTNGDVVKHSNVFLAMVYHSINATEEFPSAAFGVSADGAAAYRAQPASAQSGGWGMAGMECG